MQSDNEFIIGYIKESSQKGSTPTDAAKKEIEEIDSFLREAEKKKIRRMQLMKVLDHFNDESYRRRRNTHTPKSDDIDLNSSKEFKEIREKVVLALKRVWAGGIRPLSIRELINEVDTYDQDSLIIRAVKDLGEQEFIVRDDDGHVISGPNFE